jgi:aspartate racemase
MASLDRWDQVGDAIADAARRVENAGADFVMITAVTGHAVADRIEASLRVPLLHIGDPTADAINAAGLACVGLIGTRFTMEMKFFVERLRNRHGVEVLVPPVADRAALHQIIVEELALGVVREASKHVLVKIATDLAAQGAQAIVVGCTELPLLLSMEEYPLPAFDVTKLHTEAAIRYSLQPTAI